MKKKTDKNPPQNQPYPKKWLKSQKEIKEDKDFLESYSEAYEDFLKKKK